MQKSNVHLPQTAAGGIIGDITSAGSGITNAKIVNSYNLGLVIGSIAGGIVGNCSSRSTTSITNIEINNAYNYGDVSGNNYIGGIVGQVWQVKGTLSTYMNNIVNAGIVAQSATQKGEIIGRKVSATNMEVNNIYYSSTNTNNAIGSGTVTGTIEASVINQNLITLLNEYVTTYNTNNVVDEDFEELKMWQINSSTFKLEFK